MKKSVINLSLFPEIPAKIENYSNGRGGGQTFKKMRERVNKHKRCDGCLFYRVDDEDTGTCTLNDIIVEATQSACVDWRSSKTGKE